MPKVILKGFILVPEEELETVKKCAAYSYAIN